MVKLWPLYGTQRHVLAEISLGWDEGIHEFVILKGGRQIGGSTILDALTLYWLQEHPGMVGEMVSDDQANMKYRRKVLRQMLASLPRQYRFPVNLDNMDFLEWADPNRSTLVFEYAGIRTDSNLGRSKGLNFLYADEVGSWQDQKAVAALEAALSERHPERFYGWISTARGMDVFKEMWDEAEHAVSKRRIFVAWWRHDGYRVERASVEFKRYGSTPATSDERPWINTIRKRYGVAIEREQLAWHRWRLAEKFLGDDAMMAQEFGSLPEECFQAFGDKFITPQLVRSLHLKASSAPKAKGLQYQWGNVLDDSEVRACGLHRAPLRIWHEPEPDGVYIIAGHPAFSSSPNSPDYVVEVFRAWPDMIDQVAEFATDAMAMYQMAWVLLHLAGAYRTFMPAYVILEVSATGQRVLEEMQLMERHGYGFSSGARMVLQDFLGSINQYYYYRPDVFSSRNNTVHWKTTPNNRPWLLHGLRDTLERGHMTVRSAALIDEFAGLRQGEGGDNDQIQAGTSYHDSRAVCTALAVECWMQRAMGDLRQMIAPKEVRENDPTWAGERLVQTYLGRLVNARTHS